MKTYKVNYLKENKINISGTGNHPMWKDAICLTDFHSPWDDIAIKKIEFKAIHNSENIYFLFKVYDSQIHIHSSKNKENSINNSDRVELFFRKYASLNTYYCLEIDPTSRIMDFKAKQNKVFDFKWNWPSKDIDVKSLIETTHFSVEVAISKASLTRLGLLKEGMIETGIYRAKYNLKENGKFVPTWITWVNPNTELPNFHTPKSFGKIQLI